MENASPHELFPHVRIVMGMIIGLGIARMLTGIAGFIQHPGRHRVSLLHMLWVGSILLELVLFWWWEFGLSRLPSWSFAVYLFLISYSIVLYLLSALLFPDNISEYEGYEDFFINRRRWFFGLMAASFVLDVFDTLIKGMERWSQLSGDYLVQVPIGLLLCLVACVFAQRSIQLSVAALHIAYQAYWVGRIVYTMQ
jgi:MFS superfamily sulfate permease-like transporter